MKSVLHRLEIQNFKAFRDFTLDLGGRHLLLYGANGSGKSSLYWALYTFLQSARKRRQEVSKYFEPSNPQNLLNIHEDATAKPGEIAVTLRDTATKKDSTYRISLTDHVTCKDPVILKADLASDFITYRFFFGFSHFRNSEKFDLWPLFVKEILPFCVSTGDGNKSPMDLWDSIKSGNPNPYRERGRGGTMSYSSFAQETSRFAGILSGIVTAIGDKAQEFYDENFSQDDSSPVEFTLGITTMPSFSGTNLKNSDFKEPVVEMHIKIAGKVVKRPQSFLNEAKLTQLALSVRFAASLVNLHESDLKLLVLDDLLVSLDMSNRMNVVEILLSNTFSNYQKIFLTHDRGFFREFQRRIGTSHSDWSFVELEGTPDKNIEAKIVKSKIQKAEDYLHGHNLDEAALCLRKACEDTARRFTDCNKVFPSKSFVSLTKSLWAARKKVLSEFPVNLYEKVLRNTPDAHRNLLVAAADDDIENNDALNDLTKDRLKTNRKRLRHLVEEEHAERMRQIKLIDEILDCTDRVLNPAAHSGDPPLYTKEVQNALELIKELESTLSP